MHGRVAKVLLGMAENIDGQWVVAKLSRQDISKLIGSSREMVSRVIKHMEERSFIELDGSRIILRQRSLMMS